MPLRTPLLITVLALSLTADAQPSPAWHLVEQTSGNDTVQLLTTESSNTYTAEDGSLQHAVLQIHCAGNLSTSATISADNTFAVKSTATVTLPIRLDDDAPIPAGWANLSFHHILIYDLRDLLPPHRRMSIQVPLGDAHTETLTFDLSTLIPTMREHNCRRRL